MSIEDRLEAAQLAKARPHASYQLAARSNFFTKRDEEIFSTASTDFQQLLASTNPDEKGQPTSTPGQHPFGLSTRYTAPGSFADQRDILGLDHLRAGDGVTRQGESNQYALLDNAAEPAAAPNFGEDGFGFDDFVDIINPLQHLPLISHFYRQATGDDISEGARLAGGTLFGGPFGAAGALADIGSLRATGQDLTGRTIAALTDESPAAPSIALAETNNSPPPAPPTVAANNPAVAAPTSPATPAQAPGFAATPPGLGKAYGGAIALPPQASKAAVGPAAAATAPNISERAAQRLLLLAQESNQAAPTLAATAAPVATAPTPALAAPANSNQHGRIPDGGLFPQANNGQANPFANTANPASAAVQPTPATTHPSASAAPVITRDDQGRVIPAQGVDINKAMLAALKKYDALKQQ